MIQVCTSPPQTLNQWKTFDPLLCFPITRHYPADSVPTFEFEFVEVEINYFNLRISNHAHSETAETSAKACQLTGNH